MTMPEQKTPDVPVSLRMPAETVETLKKVAAENERTLSQELRLAARRHVESCQEASAS